MISEINSALERAQRVVISTHSRPDGDAIGSQLALGLFLQGKGKQVTMLNSDPIPFNMEWLPDVEAIQVYDSSLSHVDAVAQADTVVIVDTNATSRLGQLGQQLKGATGTKVLIDHHTDPETWFDLVYKRETASSTGEMIHELISAWDPDAITPAIAHALYVAIMTDTGSFRYSNVTPALHRAVADIVERGELDPAIIQSEVYDKKSREGMDLLARVLSTVEVHFQGTVGVMSVKSRFLEDSGASVEETDGFVNMLLSIYGVQIALLFTETEKGTKISLRSKGEWHIHKVAQRLGGGGHRNASGAFQHMGLEPTIKKALDLIARTFDLADSDEGDSLSDDDAAYLAMLGQ